MAESTKEKTKRGPNFEKTEIDILVALIRKRPVLLNKETQKGMKVKNEQELNGLKFLKNLTF